RPRASEQANLTIKDQAGKTLFERELKTDRFGVFSSDWVIPVTAPLGEYRVEVEDASGDRIGEKQVRVSRYELPTFVAEVEPDRRFYLPGENATVRVTARFVYGEPVKAGHVRVAREEERRWNFERQKWEVKEARAWEGESDKDGGFSAFIPLDEEHKTLEGENGTDYTDLEYVARYTESASGRSEERRFRLRVTKQPIHVYVVFTEFRQVAELPMRFFVVANYADGTPAITDVTVRGARESDAGALASSVLMNARARTDSHGVALVESLA